MFLFHSLCTDVANGLVSVTIALPVQGHLHWLWFGVAHGQLFFQVPAFLVYYMATLLCIAIISHLHGCWGTLAIYIMHLSLSILCPLLLTQQHLPLAELCLIVFYAHSHIPMTYYSYLQSHETMYIQIYGSHVLYKIYAICFDACAVRATSSLLLQHYSKCIKRIQAIVCEPLR